MRQSTISVQAAQETPDSTVFSEESPLLALDLFAGAGGMTLGLERAGFRVIYANELSPDASATYHYNFPGVKLETCDIRKVDAERLHAELGEPRIDVIAAGPPCQGFSSAGRKNSRDPRNSLYKEVIRFAKVFRPRVIVIENVLGMVVARKGKYLAQIEDDLESIGYVPYDKVLSATSFGVPQGRKRVFIIAILPGTPAESIFPKGQRTRVSVSQAIADLSFLGVGEACSEYRLPARSGYQRAMRARATLLHNHESPRHSKLLQRFFSRVPQGVNARNVPRIRSTGKRARLKFHPRRPSHTLTTLPEDFIHYSKNRIPTVREMARLQSFPDHFVFLGPRTTGGPERTRKCPQYTQVGNAVPPLLAESVFRCLAQVLRSPREMLTARTQN
jgi:DNA (cytosine-5)-methyltransferase 1